MRRTLAQSFRYAFAGFGYAWRTQRNLRIQVAAAVLVGVLAILFRLGAVEVALLALAIVVVIVAELANTAMEVLVDQFVGTAWANGAKTVKDVAAAGVLVAAAGAAVVGALIFLPRLR